VLDYCGSDLKPGYSIQQNKDPGENYIKYSFDIRGSIASLGINVIGDYLTHHELTILDQERQEYFSKRSQL